MKQSFDSDALTIRLEAESRNDGYDLGVLYGRLVDKQRPVEVISEEATDTIALVINLA